MLDATETVEAPAEVVETVETPVEVVTETPEIVEGEEVKADDAGETVEEAVEGDEKTDDAPAEGEDETPALIVFNPADDDTVFTEKAEQVLAKFDLSESPELQSYIETLKAKAQAVETPEIFTQIADYGDVEAVTAVLDEHNLVYSRREENGQYRPNTDKFVAAVVAKGGEIADHLYFDLASQPSQKYQGINKFEEGIAEALAIEGDTVGTVLARYQQTMALMKEGAIIPASDIPAFVPVELHAAYKTLSKETREEMQYWVDDEDTSYANERANKLNELRNIQKGINADAAEQQAVIRQRQQFEQKLTTETQETQSSFYGEMRNAMAAKLKGVTFSTDARLNTLLAHQQVTTLTQAFLNDGDGEFARAALSEAGIKFDYAKAQSLVSDVNAATQKLTIEKNSVDREGKPLNPVELNKAKSALKLVTENWLKFADDILRQEKELAASGTTNAISAEVDKRKILPKARPAAKGVGSTAVKKTDGPPAHLAYGSPELDAWYARQTIREREAKKAQAYA